jgi:transposase
LDLIYESYVPKREDIDRRSFVRHRIILSRTKTKLVNKVRSLLDKYDYQTDLTDIFSKIPISTVMDNIVYIFRTDCQWKVFPTTKEYGYGSI